MAATAISIAQPTATNFPAPLRYGVSAAVVLLIAISGYFLYGGDGAAKARSFSLLAGAAFGIVLQRGRFCFLCNFRDLYDRRDPRGVLAILAALAAGLVLYHVVFIAWMPVPAEGRLPPGAHIGPVSWALAIAAFAFGLGMAISNSCISAHLYRLGEGSPTSPFALFGALVGFGFGFLTWNSLYLTVIAEAPPLWLPHHLGYTGTLVVSLAVLAVLAALVLSLARPQPDEPREPLDLRGTARRIFKRRWPALPTGLAVGVIAMVAYFRVAPLGVTAELGSIARTAANGWDVLPETLYGLDGLRGCATAIKDALLSNNGAFVLGLVGASFAAALAADQFRPHWPTIGQVVRGLTGGVLMGWGAMIGLGCTIGVLLSGIHAGAVAGWAFLVAVTLGVVLGLEAMKRLPR